MQFIAYGHDADGRGYGDGDSGNDGEYDQRCCTDHDDGDGHEYASDDAYGYDRCGCGGDGNERAGGWHYYGDGDYDDAYSYDDY